MWKWQWSKDMSRTPRAFAAPLGPFAGDVGVGDAFSTCEAANTKNLLQDAGSRTRSRQPTEPPPGRRTWIRRQRGHGHEDEQAPHRSPSAWRGSTTSSASAPDSPLRAAQGLPAAAATVSTSGVRERRAVGGDVIGAAGEEQRGEGERASQPGGWAARRPPSGRARGRGVVGPAIAVGRGSGCGVLMWRYSFERVGATRFWVGVRRSEHSGDSNGATRASKTTPTPVSVPKLRG